MATIFIVKNNYILTITILYVTNDNHYYKQKTIYKKNTIETMHFSFSKIVKQLF